MEKNKPGLIAYLEDEKTKTRMVKTIADNLPLIKQIRSREALLDYAISIYNWFFRECMLYNQYHTFSEKQYETIEKIYERLAVNLGNLSGTSLDYELIESVVSKHRELLLEELHETFDTDNQYDIKKVCSEYSADLQKRILGYRLPNLAEPILDIGCGENAFFVKECIKYGKNVVGIDQYISKEHSTNILCRNWLEFDYQSNYWGTIISHMAFSNHVTYHMTHKTTLFEKYEETYFKILTGLKTDGIFYYSPSLPKIEMKIDKSQYSIRQIEKYENGIKITATLVRKV